MNVCTYTKQPRGKCARAGARHTPREGNSFQSTMRYQHEGNSNESEACHCCVQPFCQPARRGRYGHRRGCGNQQGRSNPTRERKNGQRKKTGKFAPRKTHERAATINTEIRTPQDMENKGSDENTEKEVTGDHKNRTRICEHERCGNVRKCNAKSRLPEKISR